MLESLQPVIKARNVGKVEDLGDELEDVDPVVLAADRHRRKRDVLDRKRRSLNGCDGRISVPFCTQEVNGCSQWSDLIIKIAKVVQQMC